MEWYSEYCEKARVMNGLGRVRAVYVSAFPFFFVI